MSVRTDNRADAVIVVVTGAVDGLTAPRLRETLRQAFGELAGRPLIIDLTEVDFLGSPGLGLLADCARESGEHRGFKPLRVVVDDTRPVIRPIQLSGLDDLLMLYYSVDTALTS